MDVLQQSPIDESVVNPLGESTTIDSLESIKPIPSYVPPSDVESKKNSNYNPFDVSGSITLKGDGVFSVETTASMNDGFKTPTLKTENPFSMESDSEGNTTYKVGNTSLDSSGTAKQTLNLKVFEVVIDNNANIETSIVLNPEKYLGKMVEKMPDWMGGVFDNNKAEVKFTVSGNIVRSIQYILEPQGKALEGIINRNTHSSAELEYLNEIQKR